jgi:hypothetical protein
LPNQLFAVAWAAKATTRVDARENFMLGYQSVLYDDIDEWIDEEMLLLKGTAVRDGVGRGKAWQL